MPVEERNGFHLIDFEPDAVTIRHFHWVPEPGTDPAEADPERLEPFHVSTYGR